MIRSWLSRCLTAALLCAAWPASAGCSRPIHVPAAPSGRIVTVTGTTIGGLVPDVLAVVGARAGCSFIWSVVPRVRLEAMFEAGQADLLVAATQVERRDRHGLFIPIVESRAALISLDSERPGVGSIAELLARRELRVALVRGFDYGAPYRAMAAQLAQQGRLYLQADPRTVARMIHAGLADVTIMPSSSFIGGLLDDPRTANMAERVRVEALPELPWIKSGIYLSNKSLSAADRATLERALNASVKAGLWWQGLQRYYAPALLYNNTRQIEAPR